MMLKKTALTLALSLGFVAAASATNTDLGLVVAPQKFSDVVYVNSEFFDTYSFSINQPTFSSGAVTSLQMSSVWGINNLQATLYSGIYGDNINDTVLNVLSGSDITKAGSGTYTAGNYYFTVSGVGTEGATKAGAYSFAVVTSLPVPEPETYAMLLAGLGLMGTIARRRKSKAV